MLGEKLAIVQLTFSNEIGRTSTAVGRLIQEGDHYFAVATEAHNSIAEGMTIPLEKQELEPLRSRSPEELQFRHRKTLPSPWK
jgi:hypothetical protein